MRNSLGQEIVVGAPVVLVSQGQGWVSIGVGRVCKIGKVPTIEYLDGQKSAGVQRWERLLVISEDEYEVHRKRYELFRHLEDEFWAHVSKEPKSRYWSSAYRGTAWRVPEKAPFRDFINQGFVKAGYEPWYD